jgi:hypothetical protein
VQVGGGIGGEHAVVRVEQLPHQQLEELLGDPALVHTLLADELDLRAGEGADQAPCMCARDSALGPAAGLLLLACEGGRSLPPWASLATRQLPPCSGCSSVAPESQLQDNNDTARYGTPPLLPSQDRNADTVAGAVTTEDKHGGQVC